MTFRPLPVDPKKSAVLAGLRYVRCDSAGFTRRATGKGFSYIDLEGRPIRDKETLNRIRSLVIPPAWKNVWICSIEHGHLQATGVDARGRRQYRYHPGYRQIRNQTKFHRMHAFAKALPSIRARVEHDLKLHGLPREKVIATVVRLLETTFIRIGNEEYAKQNASFGLTTLHDQHVRIEGYTIRFHFRGKSAQDHDITVHDKRLARIVRDCRDLPGYDLFQYVDDAGQTHSIDSSDVNAYLRDACGEDFTAKDFRTWAGTVQTALALAETGPFRSETEAKRNIADAIKNTASQLGNRPATCRNYYVHPAVTDGYLDGTLLNIVKPPEETGEPLAGTDLHPEERAVMKLLQGWRR
jgi:DNA topoisomerase-1